MIQMTFKRYEKNSKSKTRIC